MYNNLDSIRFYHHMNYGVLEVWSYLCYRWDIYFPVKTEFINNYHKLYILQNCSDQIEDLFSFLWICRVCAIMKEV
jgi:hypothetical protein